jgi:hypothetical protein
MRHIRLNIRLLYCLLEPYEPLGPPGPPRTDKQSVASSNSNRLMG